MSSQNQQSGFVVFLVGFFKLIIAILLGLLIGGAFFIAGSYIYQQAIVPSQNNAAALQTIQGNLTDQYQQLKEKNTQLDERITALEISQTDQTNQIDEMSTTVTQNQKNLDTLLNDQTDLQEQVTRIEETLIKISQLQYDLGEENDKLSVLVNQEDEDPTAYLQPIRIEIELLKVMQQINRSRLLIYQANYGLAKQEIDLATQYLEDLKGLTDPTQLDSILLWQARLDVIKTHLPDQPALADEDMEILWQLVSKGFPQETAALEDAAVVESENQTSTTPTATPEPTPKP